MGVGANLVKFEPSGREISVPTGTLLSEAAKKAGEEINQPCGGQGRCGRCVVQVLQGDLRRRSTVRLTQDHIDLGYALACQSLIENDLIVLIPPQEVIERRLTTDKTVAEIETPSWYYSSLNQSIRRYRLQIAPPSLDDQRDDLSRIKTAFSQQHKLSNINISRSTISSIGSTLREGEWEVTAIVNHQESITAKDASVELVKLLPGFVMDHDPLWGIAIDIGTTTVTVWLVDLITGDVLSQASEYNRQIHRGEDVISRIIYATKDNGLAELQDLVVRTINDLIVTVCERIQSHNVTPGDIIKASVSGNSTMMHLFTGISPESIRLMPFITAFNDVPSFPAREIGLNIWSEGVVDCLPGVASYLGSDITAGVYSSGMDDTQDITLFMDVGTNGEIVLGSSEWLVGCACSAGPAFEGAGVMDGMRATSGAIEEVWINGDTYEPEYRVIGGGQPRGICGSGLISLLAEMFMTGVVDRGGNLNTKLTTPRIREGDHGIEYVIAWGNETFHGDDIVITNVDINNLVRAKAAIYAGFIVLAESVGVPIELIDQMLVGGSFGKYINVEKATQIGLLPDMSWDKFQFLGNTSVRGAYYALLDQKARLRIKDIASRMTYIELSADNSFYDAFMAALFLPHTDLSKFPNVSRELAEIGMV